MKCFLCKRALTNPANAQRGYGDDCAAKYQRYLAATGTDESELARLANNERAARWVRNFQFELSKGKTRRARQCLDAARRASEPIGEWVTTGSLVCVAPETGERVPQILAPVFS